MLAFLKLFLLLLYAAKAELETISQTVCVAAIIWEDDHEYC